MNKLLSIFVTLNLLFINCSESHSIEWLSANDWKDIVSLVAEDRSVNIKVTSDDPIIIDEALIIDEGQEIVIDGSMSDFMLADGFAAPAFEVYGSLSLSHLKMRTQGTVDIKSHGIIYVEGGKLLIDDLEATKFIDSDVSYQDRGFIHLEESEAVLTDITLEDIRTYLGSAIYALRSEISIEGAHLEDNEYLCDDDLTGGIVHIEDTDASIRSSSFINNGSYDVSSNGGAIAISNGGQKDVIIKDCHFEGNYAAKGAAIYAKGIIDEIEASTFIDNRAGYGGAIFADHVTLRSCSFKEDRANYGSALYLHDGARIEDTEIKDEGYMYGAIYTKATIQIIGGDIEDEIYVAKDFNPSLEDISAAIVAERPYGKLTVTLDPEISKEDFDVICSYEGIFPDVALSDQEYSLISVTDRSDRHYLRVTKRPIIDTSCR